MIPCGVRYQRAPSSEREPFFDEGRGGWAQREGQSLSVSVTRGGCEVVWMRATVGGGARILGRRRLHRRHKWTAGIEAQLWGTKGGLQAVWAGVRWRGRVQGRA